MTRVSGYRKAQISHPGHPGHPQLFAIQTTPAPAKEIPKFRIIPYFVILPFSGKLPLGETSLKTL
jgi:hypothetical protein